MIENLQNEKEFYVMQEQPTEEKPYYVDDYPYGFRLRCKIRYWIETTKNGQRFVSQTLNPKTDQWNKPKKSTYSQILIVGLNEEGHVKSRGLSASYRSLKEADEWGQKYSKYFSDYQAKEYKAIIGMLKVFDKVKVTVRSRKFKHIHTGVVTTSVPMHEFNLYVEVDDDGNEVDTKKEEKEKKEKNRQLNRAAVGSAVNEGLTVDEAYGAFRRA